MPVQGAADDWITVEDATDEPMALAVAHRLRRLGVTVRLVPVEPCDPSGANGDLTVQVSLDDFEIAIEALESLDGEDV